MKRKCCNCLWGDGCGYGMPCDYFTPLDYEDELLTIEEKCRKDKFMDSWQEFMEYCAEIYN